MMEQTTQRLFGEPQDKSFPFGIFPGSDFDTVTKIIQTQWKTDGIIKESPKSLGMEIPARAD